MKVAYSVERATGALVIVGRVRLEPLFEVTFDATALGRLVAGELRPFVLAAGSDLRAWPLLPPEVVSEPPTAQLWANLKNKLADHRPLTWVGWPLALVDYAFVLATTGAPPETNYEVVLIEVGDPRPRVDAVLLRPNVPLEKMLAHELTHDGFKVGYRSGARDGWIRRERDDDDDSELEPGGEATGEGAREVPCEARAERPLREDGADAGSNDRLLDRPAERRDGARADGDHPGVDVRAGLGAEDDAGVVGAGDGAPARDDADAAVDGDERGGVRADARDGAGDVRTAEADALIASWLEWVPAHVVEDFPRDEPPPPLERVRIRVTGSSGVRGIVDGEERDAVRCPAREGSVWTLAPNGIGYRLNEGEWAPIVARRRARGLDDL